MKLNGLRWISGLCAAVAGLAGIASAAGVFLRGDLATMNVVTMRGEHVEVLLNGVYRWNSKAIASEGIGWDYVTLLLVVPAILFLLPALARGSTRGALAVGGLLAYLLYQYFEYAVFLAYGPLFLLYVAIFSLSLTAIALILGRLDLGEVAGRFTTRFPRRGMIGLGIWMAVLLSMLWLPLIAATIDGDVSGGELDGGWTLVVQAFDLGLLVPLGLFTAATVLLRQPVGYVLSAIVVVKAITMPIAIIAMLVFEWIATDELAIVPIGLFALTALASAAIGMRVYSSLREAPVGAPVRPAAGRPATAQ